MNRFNTLRAFHSDIDLDFGGACDNLTDAQHSPLDGSSLSHAETLQEHLDRVRQNELIAISEETTFTPRALMRRREETFRRHVLHQHAIRRERQVRERIRQFFREYL